MGSEASGMQESTREEWPSHDPDGLPVRFTSREPRPRTDEFEPVLRGVALRLEPMRESHVAALCRVGLDPAVMRHMPDPVRTADQMASFVRNAVGARAALTAMPFVTLLMEGTSETVVGTTRFMAIDARNRRMEIGGTWIGRQWQRTRVNTEAKYLMLRHAFEELECLRVEFKTDSLNERSRAALLRIGAVQEGVFRNHVITSEGRIRHSVYFSITAEEWPEVRVRLEKMLA
jgi:RimJ/RimL family protein N-acetyltransferase